MPDSYARYTGQKAGIGFSYDCSWGTSPGRAAITYPPDAGQAARFGIVEVHFQGDLFMTLRGCRLAKPGRSFGVSAAPVHTIEVEDRRWRWEFGKPVDGDYNVPDGSGGLKRERTPRQLAEELLEALGETNYSVTALPQEPRPRVHWEQADPKSELDSLLSTYGCAIAYDPFTDSVGIVSPGDGTFPPVNEPSVSKSQDFSQPPQPDKLRVYGTPTIYQTALALGDPHGLDLDGEWKKQDDLSYKPAEGWEKDDPERPWANGQDYTDAVTGEQFNISEWAQRYIWRCYKIVGQASGGISPQALVGTADEPTHVRQLGPYLPELLEYYYNEESKASPFVRGQFVNEYLSDDNTTSKATRFRGSFTIDHKRQLVIFSDPMYLEDGATVKAAELHLIVAYNVTINGVPVSESLTRNAARGVKDGDLVMAQHVDTLGREVIEATGSVGGIGSDNLEKFKQEASYYLDAMADTLDRDETRQYSLPGLQRWAPDGLVRSVRWSFSTSSPPQTDVSFNTDRNRYVLPWEEQLSERLKDATDYKIRKILRRQRYSEVYTPGLDAAVDKILHGGIGT